MIEEIIMLFVLAMPVSCIAWTVTHEEIFREIHEYCVDKSKNASSVVVRKFFYMLTCEYCFSHYVTIAVLVLTDYHLLYADWRGYLVGGFALVWVANVYMSLFARIRLDIKAERLDAEIKEEQLEHSHHP